MKNNCFVIRLAALSLSISASSLHLSNAFALPIPAENQSTTYQTPQNQETHLIDYLPPAQNVQIQAQASEPSENENTPNPTAPELNASEDMPTQFGARGQDRWYINAAGATTLDNDEARRLGLVGAGVSHFFINGHSINFEVNGLAFDQTGDDAVGLNINALMRWHFYRDENWSLYVDGGAGLLGSSNEVPSAGSKFNFTPQVGGGATVRISDERRLMVGLRWHHISNANLYRSNPGRDSILGYVGVNMSR